VVSVDEVRRGRIGQRVECRNRLVENDIAQHVPILAREHARIRELERRGSGSKKTRRRRRKKERKKERHKMRRTRRRRTRKIEKRRKKKIKGIM
jgi:hypothetical protein